MNKAEQIIEQFGRAVTDMFEQMNKGNWVDDHGHEVRMNKHMLALIPIVQSAIDHRAALAAQPSQPKDWRQPTTVLQRTGDALQLLCNGKRPDDAMITSWLDHSSEALQAFCVEHGPSWCQGIALIDAAMQMVDQPTEILTPESGADHERRAAPAQPEVAKQVASPIFVLAIQALNGVKAWRDCDGNDGFPHEVREQVEAVLGAFEMRYTAPTDASAERLQWEILRLRAALRFYADKGHFMLSDQSAWDTVSGEPQNYWCDEAGTATVEDGSLAGLALANPELGPVTDESEPRCEPSDWVRPDDYDGDGSVNALARAALVGAPQPLQDDCPFCGAEENGIGFCKGSQIILCSNCFAQGPQADNADGARASWRTRKQFKPISQEDAELPALFREALAWGMTYGPDIPAHQWDEIRESMVVQYSERANHALRKGDKQ